MKPSIRYLRYVPLLTGLLLTRVGAAVPLEDEVSALVTRGRSQYLAGDPVAASETFAQVQQLEEANPDAMYFLGRIAAENDGRERDRELTSTRMIGEVKRAWQRPEVGLDTFERSKPEPAPSLLFEKLDRIILPEVNFTGMELSRVVNTLSVISGEFDQTATQPKGVNLVLVDPSAADPMVSIALRNLPLRRILDLITESIGYQYEVQDDAVIVRPGAEHDAILTQFFPVSRSTVLRMIGRGVRTDAAETNDTVGSDGPEEGKAIREFLQLAGVNFDGVPGSGLAFDGSQLIATQTPRNLERVRNILQRYDNVRQVEIEAKFMEVQEGALEELGVQWNVATKETQRNAGAQAEYTTAGANRSLPDAFRNATTTQEIGITGPGLPEGGLKLPASAPSVPGGVLLGAAASPLASITGIIGEFDVSAIVRALSQKSGTELLSAPKLTVLSGNQATIRVAQELRYPVGSSRVDLQACKLEYSIVSPK